MCGTEVGAPRALESRGNFQRSAPLDFTFCLHPEIGWNNREHVSNWDGAWKRRALCVFYEILNK